MDNGPGSKIEQPQKVILVRVSLEGNTAYLNYFHEEMHQTAVLSNPEVITGGLLTGSEISIILHSPRQAELKLDDDFMPEAFCRMLTEEPPVISTGFGLISEAVNDEGRYYMLRDHNADGLLLCTGTYSIKKGRGRCSEFDNTWPLKYNLIENFFYGLDRPESEIKKWKHRSVCLTEIDETLTMKNLNRKYRDNAAGWHRYNFFFADDWSPQFYRKQAKLGFIAITHIENDTLRLTPQLQREYAVLDWENLKIDRRVHRILHNSRIENENIRLHIEPDPATAIEHLKEVWDQSWITEEYTELITNLAALCRSNKDRGFRIWGVTLSAGDDDKIIAGELGYSIGKTYTNLSGFFHREERKYNNFGKLQMVMLARKLEKAGIAFWNLGQPYMEYKLKLGADVVPRGLFLKRWDRAVRGRTPDLEQ